MAEGLDQALREEVATKTDLAAVKTELAADIAAVKMELTADIAAVRRELATEIASVRTDLAAVKHDMLRWMVGLAFAQVGLIVALVRLLPH